jgi:hypothetical protein
MTARQTVESYFDKLSTKDGWESSFADVDGPELRERRRRGICGARRED